MLFTKHILKNILKNITLLYGIVYFYKTIYRRKSASLVLKTKVLNCFVIIGKATHCINLSSFVWTYVKYMITNDLKVLIKNKCVAVI